MKKIILPLLLVALTSIHSASAVTFGIGLDEVVASNNSLVPTNTLALLVVQNGSSSFTNLNAGASAQLNTYISGTAGNGNYIAWKGNFSGGDVGVFYDSPSFTIDGVNVTYNAVFALYWFPTLTLSATNIAAGTSYGYYTSTNASQFGSDTNWNVGANDAAYYNLNAWTIDNTGSLPPSNPYPTGLTDSALKATYVVAPEPSTYCLLGVGALALLIMQRRRRA
jgi:hypothetical protein